MVLKERFDTFLQAYWYRYLVDAKLYECEKLGVKMEKQGALEATSSRINGGGNAG